MKTYVLRLAAALLSGAAFLASPAARAATMDEYITCSLVYGALFQAAKNANHSGMTGYVRPRLQAVTPYMQNNRDNPAAKAKLREIATSLEDEIRYRFVRQATEAIKNNDGGALRASMGRVIQCDRAFGLDTFPLPIAEGTTETPEKFLAGFYEGCLAKQRSAPSPYKDQQLQQYCSCMTGRAKSAGLDATSPDARVGNVVRDSHPGCLAGIQSRK
jgi:hypothetical protein